MLARALVVLAFSLSLPVPARAQDPPQEGSYWGSILADFFLGPEKKQEFRWRGKLVRGATLEVKGVNGRVFASPASGGEVELVAVKHGRRQDPASVEVKVVEHDGGFTICALYPSSDPARPNECRPGKDGRTRVRNNDVSVDFTLKLPAGVSLVARTVNGRIETERLAGNVEAHTVNGRVRVAAEGYAAAETVNGSIEASLGRADWKDPLAFKTVNGSVTLTLPAQASTAVRVETVNGRIQNDFTLQGPARFTRRELAGTIGGGGRELSVKTVNGGVRLRKAS